MGPSLLYLQAKSFINVETPSLGRVTQISLIFCHLSVSSVCRFLLERGGREGWLEFEVSNRFIFQESYVDVLSEDVLHV